MITSLVSAGTPIVCAAGTVTAYFATKNAVAAATTAVALNVIGYAALTFALGSMTLMSMQKITIEKVEDIPNYLFLVALTPIAACVGLFFMIFSPYAESTSHGSSKRDSMAHF